MSAGNFFLQVGRENKEYKVSRNQIVELPTVEFTEFTPEEGKVYLEPNVDWMSADARFAAYFFMDKSTDTWVNMERVPNTYIYSCDIPDGYADVILCRMNPSTTANNWNNMWNQTADLKLVEGNVYTIKGWDKSGEWTSKTSAVTLGPGMASDYAFSNNGKEIRMKFTDTENVFVAKDVKVVQNAKLFAQQYYGSTNYKGSIIYLDPSKKVALTTSGTDFLMTTAGTYDFYLDLRLNTKYLYVAKTSDNYSSLQEQKYSTGKLFLKPNSNWKSNGARFAAYFMDSNKSVTKWASMTQTSVDSNIYEVSIPSGTWKYVIFCRMNGGNQTNDWNNKWNQTADLEIIDGNPMFTVKDGTWDKGGGSWSMK